MDNLYYGIIGNCRSAALVSREGSISWCCLPVFDSSSVFAGILDPVKGGHFSIEPVCLNEVDQRYIHDTNILLTRFYCDDGEFEVIDFMPIYRTEKGGYYYPSEVIRYLHVRKGKPSVRFRFDPQLCYARGETRVENRRDYIKAFTVTGYYESVYLYTDLDKQKVLTSDLITLEKEAFFLLSYNQKLIRLDTDRIYLELQRTRVYWLNWIDRTVRFSDYYKHIKRSALVLKLLTYQKSGAILAAVTTSLPETIGEERNWDYRFCWVRDSSMIINTLIQMGHVNSAENFLDFILDSVPKKNDKMQIMYGISGEKELDEHLLEHLSGYEGSKPVRIGNDAYKQKQNDIYGVLMDVIYQKFMLYKDTLDKQEDLWTFVRSIARIVEDNWQNPDKGIWEIRSDQKHFVFSKVLCWVAMDRARRIAGILEQEDMSAYWANLAGMIRKEIIDKGWNEEAGAFTQSYENGDMDAANLLMERFGFINAQDPKYIATVHKIRDELCVDGLMYRYRNHDDFGKPSSSFTICTFWMIQSLAKIGEKEQAREMFENLLSCTNHVGLLSEDLDFNTKRLLGNFPQGYSHLGLIDTAILLCEGTPKKPEYYKA